MGGRSLPLFLIGGFLLVMGLFPSLGMEEAVFLDGRTLRLERHQGQGDQVLLVLEGGGRMTVPRSRIRFIRPGEDPGSSVEPPHEGKTFHPPGTPAGSPMDPPIAGDPVSPPDLFSSIARLALKYDLDTQLVAAVVLVESSLDPEAVSPKGARGLMQLMPETAARHGVRDPFDPVENLEAGISHLKELLDRYQGDLELSLAGYNAGEAAVARYGGVPPYPETVRFIHRVLALTGAR